MGDGLLKERVELVQLLRYGGIKTRTPAFSIVANIEGKPKHQGQFAASEKDNLGAVLKGKVMSEEKAAQ
ncbi:hypothetical protein H0H92_009182, partial [Tricholoma furcatifolium]